MNHSSQLVILVVLLALGSTNLNPRWDFNNPVYLIDDIICRSAVHRNWIPLIDSGARAWTNVADSIRILKVRYNSSNGCIGVIDTHHVYPTVTIRKLKTRTQGGTRIEDIAKTIKRFNPETGKFHEIDIAINKYRVNDIDSGKINLRIVMTHEFGHFLGLMDDSLDPSRMMYWRYHDSLSITRKDSLDLQTLYGPVK